MNNNILVQPEKKDCGCGKVKIDSTVRITKAVIKLPKKIEKK